MTNSPDQSSAESCDLKSCPFCCGDSSPCDTGVVWIMCDDCKAEGPVADTLQEATLRWNHRAQPITVAKSAAGDMTLADLITMIDMVENHTDAIDLADRLWPLIRTTGDAQSVQVPEGWKLVPVEPSQEMVRRAYAAQTGAINAGFAQAYRDMLDAAPAASQPSPAATVEKCANCNGTKRAVYYSGQASAHEERDCHVCRPRSSAATGDDLDLIARDLRAASIIESDDDEPMKLMSRLLTPAERDLVVALIEGRHTQPQAAPDTSAGIMKAMEIVGEMRMSEAGIFDEKHSGQRGEDRSNALYDAYVAIRSALSRPQDK